LLNKKPDEEIKAHLNEKFNYRNHYNGNYKSYLDFSLYGEQVHKLLNKTCRENVLFLTFEDFFFNFENYRKVLESFLDLDLSQITLNKVNETTFAKKSILRKKKPRLDKRVISRLKYEYDIIKGAPKGLKIQNPIKYKTTREEIESMVLPHIKNDILKLESLGYNLNSWPSYLKLKEKVE
jgi:hypothetical protein